MPLIYNKFCIFNIITAWYTVIAIGWIHLARREQTKHALCLFATRTTARVCGVPGWPLLLLWTSSMAKLRSKKPTVFLVMVLLYRNTGVLLSPPTARVVRLGVWPKTRNHTAASHRAG